MTALGDGDRVHAPYTLSGWSYRGDILKQVFARTRLNFKKIEIQEPLTQDSSALQFFRIGFDF